MPGIRIQTLQKPKSQLSTLSYQPMRLKDTWYYGGEIDVDHDATK